jgi:hypothetical protein
MPRESLVVDTGPLLTFLCLRFLDEIHAGNAERDRSLGEIRGGPLPDRRRQEQMDGFFRASSLLATSHVFVESLRLRDHSYLRSRAEEFRKSSLSSLSIVEERVVRLADLAKSPYRELVIYHGLADAGVVWLAERERCALVTDEKALYSAYRSDSKFRIRLLDQCLD